MSIFSKIFGDPQEKLLKQARETVEKINGLEKEFEVLSLENLKEKTREFKQRLSDDETLDGILPEAFALVRESAKRTLGQRHFDVQLIGGMVLHQGKIAEMKTGEGKTLAATLAVYLNALEGRGVHIVTVNDYLAKRDVVWMGQIYDALGLSVGCIVNDGSYVYDSAYENKSQNSNLKTQNYNLKVKTEKNNDDSDKDKVRDVLGSFKVVESYLRPCSRKEAYLADITYGTNNEFGFDFLRDNLVFDVKEQVQRGYNFAIVDEVDSILIDEARTPLIISQPDLESSKMYQDFAKIIPQLKENDDFNIDEKLKAATLTEEGIEKIERILGVGNIYTDKGINFLHHLEQALRARVFFQRDKDYIIKEGQVIIVDEFTGRLLQGRRYSGGLHQAIEAKEGVKVQAESKTLATITFQNYFRFYKKLAGMTGTALTSAEELDKVYKLDVMVIPTNKPMQRKDLPDLVFKTEKAKFLAVAKEVKKRHELSQPVLVGTTSIEKNEYLSKILQREGVKCEVLNAKHHEREGEIIAQAGRIGAVTVATNMAGRGVDIMLGGVPPSKLKTQSSKLKTEEEKENEFKNEEYKKWEQEHNKIVELGGLFVIGTERHEARRIDNQLRGRAGRQGDPGCSHFFVSLEDDLMRIFGGDRIKGLMDMLKIPEEQAIEARILSNVIEKAQTKVEGMHFDLRKHLLEYDDVISKHRNRVYAIRRESLDSGYDVLKEKFLDILNQEIEKLVMAHTADNFNYDEIAEEVRIMFPSPFGLRQELVKMKQAEHILDYLKRLGSKVYEEKEKNEGAENLLKVLRFVFLKTLDLFWTEHLEALEYLKDSVRLRAYGGKDPLVEYKTESHKLFLDVQEMLNSQIARTFFKLSIK